MKKVLLVNTNTEKAPYPIPPLGLSLVKQSIEKNYDVVIFDGMFNEKDRLLKLIKSFAPDYIGVGIRNVDDVVMGSGNYYLNDIKENFVDPIREATSAPLILGGGAFSIFPGPMLQLFGADFGVIGEGEGRVGMLLDALEKGGDPGSIPGVICKGEGIRGGLPCFAAPSQGSTMTKSPPSLLDTHLDYEPYRQRSSYPVQTKRGCNQKCIYCSYPSIEGNQFRLRSPEDVTTEIEGIIERLGDVSIEFVDSTFNSPAGHAEAICKEIISRNIKVRLRTMGVNPGAITDDLLSLMKKAGFLQIDCTPDSGSETMLASLQKNFSRTQLERAAEVIKKHQMPTMWFFMFGGPSESEDTVKETFDFIDRFVDEQDMVHMTEGLRVFPGTRLSEIAIEEGVVEPNADLLRPFFYVSPKLGKERLSSLLTSNAATRPNCVHALESSPGPEMMGKALALREEEGLDEPMFRTLLRIRRENFGS